MSNSEALEPPPAWHNQPNAIKGYWYPPNSSTRHPARLQLDGQRYTISLDEHETISPSSDEVFDSNSKDQHTLQGDFHHINISDRVGNIPRKLTLTDQSLFETPDNDAIDALLERSEHRAQKIGVLHQLETRWRWIGTALLVTVLLSFITIRWGMPWASKQIAYSLPVSVHEMIAAETLQVLDNSMLKPSKLSAQRQREIQQHFEWALLPLQDTEFRYQLHFRSLPLSPNAFALPSGDIIITDELIKLAKNQQEIDSILLHEIGHVAHRHGMRQVLQSSALTLALIMITGEVSAVGEWAVAFPVFLLQSHYSREHESDADNFAFEKMLKANIDPIHFANIMQRMGSSGFADLLEQSNENDDDKGTPKNKTDQSASKEPDVTAERLERTLGYLMSHPATVDRVNAAKAYSAKFRAERE